MSPTVQKMRLLVSGQLAAAAESIKSDGNLPVAREQVMRAVRLLDAIPDAVNIAMQIEEP